MSELFLLLTAGLLGGVVNIVAGGGGWWQWRADISRRAYYKFLIRAGCDALLLA